MWACFMLARVSAPSSQVREREKEGGRERKREGEKERDCLFLKGMTGALAPFSYLVTEIIRMDINDISHSISLISFKHLSLVLLNLLSTEEIL